jgi:hypothetical protein
MSSIVPTPFLFRYSLNAFKVKALPKRSKTSLLALPDSCSLPNLREVEDAPVFGDVRVGWNEKGFGISVHVSGRTMPLSCDTKNPTESDGLQVWIDTRNTQNIHRASRFCHHFCFLPASKTGKPDKPFAQQLEIARSREQVTLADAKSLSVSVTAKRGGYLLEAWLPAKVLNGFDPEATPRIGFYYHLRDSELGDQYLTVDEKFPFANDPSLWTTLELTE